MADAVIAAPAPAAEAPAAPAAPAPEAPPAASEKPASRGKQTDRIEAAAKLLAEADAAKAARTAEPPAEPPPADAAPPAEEPAKDDAEKPRDVTSAEWVAFTKRSRKLAKREADLSAREAKLADVGAKLSAWDADQKLLREDPRAFWAKHAETAGSSFEQEYARFADAYLSGGKPEAKVEAALKELADLKAKLAKDEEDTKAARAAEQHQKLVGGLLGAIATPAQANTSYTLRKHGPQVVLSDALAVAESLFADLGRQPTDAELASALDTQYGAYYKEFADSLPRPPAPAPSGHAEQVNGAVQSANTAAPKAPKTLTNGGSAERAAPPRKLTEKERLAEATKLLGG